MIYWRQPRQVSFLRWGLSFIFVIGMYVSLIFVALNWAWAANDSITPKEPMEAIMIDLAPVPVAPEMPLNDVPPGPEQEETPPPEPEPIPEPEPEPEIVPEPEPEIEPLPDLPVVKKAEVVQRKPVPKPKPIKAPEIEPVEEEITQENKAPPVIEAPPDDVPAAPTESAVSSVPSQASITWQSKLLAHIGRHKRYPRKARRERQEAVVYVWIKINRDGTVLESRLERPSIYEALNKETLALITRSEPLPPPPEDMKGDTIEFVVPVEFFLK